MARFSIGLIVSCMSIATAAVVENLRKDSEILINEESVCGEIFVVSDMSIWMQMPQYALMGIADILVISSLLQHTFGHVRHRLLSVVLVMLFCTMAVGYNLAGGLANAFPRSGCLRI